MTTALIITFLIAIAGIRLFAETFCIHKWEHARKLISGIIGAAVVMIFVHFLRDIYRQIEITDPLLMLSIPAGFIVVMYIERHIHHHKNKQKELEELIELNNIVSGVISFFVGVVAITTVQPTILQEIVFLAILLMYAFVHDMTLHMLHHINQQPHKAPFIKKVFSAALPCIGAAIAFFITIPASISTSLLGFISGAFMYMIAREILPHDRTSVPRYFLLGAFTMAVLFVANLMIVG